MLQRVGRTFQNGGIPLAFWENWARKSDFRKYGPSKNEPTARRHNPRTTTHGQKCCQGVVITLEQEKPVECIPISSENAYQNAPNWHTDPHTIAYLLQYYKTKKNESIAFLREIS